MFTLSESRKYLAFNCLIFVTKLLFMILLDISMEYASITVLIVLLVLAAWLLYEFRTMKDEVRKSADSKNEAMKLKLQAYERLTLFADRISLRNLVARTSYGGLSVVELQLTLLETIRTEYEYNVSQQIYVSADIWKAIGNLKDQNIYIINQIAANIPSQALGVELCKLLLEYTSQKNADLKD